MYLNFYKFNKKQVVPKFETRELYEKILCLISHFKEFFVFYLLSMLLSLITITILPKFAPQLIDKDGFLLGNNDSRYFFQLAVEKYSEILENGFENFELRPEGQIIAGIMTLVFYFTGITHLIVLIPVFCLFYAVTNHLYFRYLTTFFNRKSSFLAVLLLLFLPSSMIFYVQGHKELFTSLGFAFLLSSFSNRKWEAVNLAIGLSFFYFSKTYLVPLVSVSLLFLKTWMFFLERQAVRRFMVALSICFMFFCISFFKLPHLEPASSSMYSSQVKDQVACDDCFIVTRKLVVARNWFKTNHSGEASIDYEKEFISTLDVIRYLPEMLLIGYFKPIPFSRGSENFRAQIELFIASMEMVFFYFCIFVLCSNGAYRSVKIIFFLGLIPILVLVFSIPNMGALYRYRQPYWLPLYLCGLAATIQFIEIKNINILKFIFKARES